MHEALNAAHIPVCLHPCAHWKTVIFAIIGIVVVFGAVLGGYLMEHGNLKVLLQPAELLIIGGAGAGTVLIANPLHILKQIAAGIGVVFKGSKFTKQRYMESLKIAYELLNKARRQGLMSLESDVETSEHSARLGHQSSRPDQRVAAAARAPSARRAGLGHRVRLGVHHPISHPGDGSHRPGDGWDRRPAHPRHPVPDP